jgi:hypothetical protein
MSSAFTNRRKPRKVGGDDEENDSGEQGQYLVNFPDGFDLALRHRLTYTRPGPCSQETESHEIKTKVETSVILRSW